MPGLDFDPLTGQYNIAGTSYRLQLGLINSKWAIRLLKGKETKATKVFNDGDLLEDIPTPQSIVNWTLSVIVIPDINPYQIRKTAQLLHTEAKVNKNKIKIIAPIKEANKINLDPVPNLNLKIQKQIGWVVQDDHTESTKVKKAESLGLENFTCVLCGVQIHYCPNCGTEFGKINL